MEKKYGCYDFDIEKAFGVSFVFVSPDWEKFLNSFTDDYKKYPPRIAPNPHLARLGLYYFDKDVAVLVTPAGIYSYRAASLTLRGPAYRPLSKFFEIWGEGENVQLILACPDMYEALKETAIILETMVDAGMIGKSLKVCSLVEQALAKAEGRQGGTYNE